MPDLTRISGAAWGELSISYCRAMTDDKGIPSIGREFWSDIKVLEVLRSLALQHGRGDGLDQLLVAFAAEEAARDFVSTVVAQVLNEGHTWAGIADRVHLSRPAVAQRYDARQRIANRERQAKRVAESRPKTP